MKPILFNTEMVKAILDVRKTTTRRIVKLQPELFYESCGQRDIVNPNEIAFKIMEHGGKDLLMLPPYQPGDVLYVRETFAKYNCAEKECIMADYSGCNGCTHTKDGYCYVYKSSHEYDVNVKWKPSIFMPKEAARIFLRVTGVRAEKLQDITEDEAKLEGCLNVIGGIQDCRGSAKHQFTRLWDSTVKKSDLPLYGWDANPWVWVYEFERCEKPKEGLI